MTAPQPWPTGRLCPATSNLPTRMLASTWHTICASYQRRETVGANRQNGMTPEDFAAISAARFPCAVCQGRTLPPGLELITQQEAEQMARNTKRGKCELCGEVANVGTNHGSATCPKCTHVQAALANRLQAVAKAARAMGKAEDLIKALIPDGGSLAVQVTATLLQEISGIVGYDGEDPAELVEAVRRRALACASCDAEDVLHEIREIVGYSPDMGDSGLADAVRASAAAVPAEQSDLDQQWIDLMRACGLEDDGGCRDWGWAAAAAIQTIAELINRQDDLLTKERVNNASLRSALRGDLDRSTRVIEELRAELTLAEQARDEWEQRCAAAEESMQDMEAELCNRDNGAATNADNTYLLDIALKALRGEGPDGDQLASLIEAARRAA